MAIFSRLRTKSGISGESYGVLAIEARWWKSGVIGLAGSSPQDNPGQFALTLLRDALLAMPVVHNAISGKRYNLVLVGGD